MLMDYLNPPEHPPISEKNWTDFQASIQDGIESMIMGDIDRAKELFIKASEECVFVRINKESIEQKELEFMELQEKHREEMEGIEQPQQEAGLQQLQG